MPNTWGGRSQFEYSGSVETGTDIVYGKGWNVRVDAEDYVALRHHFLNRIVPVGTSRTDPPADSLGAWLIANVTITAIASYVAPILVLEGYAKRVDKHDICVIR
ncbi:MAG: hypothetical protein AB1894_13945 [Chloroflexota bacterium]